MSDKYHIRIKCAHCKKWNPENEDKVYEEGVYYAESSGFTTFTCEHCKKKNGIVLSFEAIKISE